MKDFERRGSKELPVVERRGSKDLSPVERRGSKDGMVSTVERRGSKDGMVSTVERRSSKDGMVSTVRKLFRRRKSSTSSNGAGRRGSRVSHITVKELRGCRCCVGGVTPALRGSRRGWGELVNRVLYT